MKKTRDYNHLLHTIDIMVEEAVHDIHKDGKKISCAKGCSFCCYLLVEVSWEEATLLANWIENQHPKARQEFTKRVKDNAKIARKIFEGYKNGSKFCHPFKSDTSIPERIYDKYFFKNNIPCPFLHEGACAAYEARPTPCRMHMVTSPANLCSNQVPESVPGYYVPERIDQLKEEIGPLNRAFFKDQRWGQLGIMVETVLNTKKSKRA